MNHGENLYDKLNNVHATLRKSRDDALRGKQLAEERLRISRKDREDAEKKDNEMREELRRLKEKAVEMKSTNARMEAENRLSEKEVSCVGLEIESKSIV